MTMRDLIGLHGREYLEQKVTSDGKPYRSGEHYGGPFGTRVEWIVAQQINGLFKNEVERATREMIANVKNEFKKAHDALLQEQISNIKTALSKVMGEAR